MPYQPRAASGAECSVFLGGSVVGDIGLAQWSGRHGTASDGSAAECEDLTTYVIIE
jgi:hypothetical protein